MLTAAPSPPLQLAYAQEEQAFLRDEYADTQDRLAGLAQEEEDAPNARAMQRVTRSIQEAERRVSCSCRRTC
jgi:hypothetical protein